MDDLFDDFPIYEPENGRVCSKCGLKKPDSAFSIANAGAYRRTECKSCRNKAHKLRDELRKIHTQPDDDYECPICERVIKDIPYANRTPIVLDHCHETETFRGWLCDFCNKGLGAFDDDLGRLKNAIEYLRRHSGEEEG